MRLSTLGLAMCLVMPLWADEAPTDTLRYWNLQQWSQTTVSNLASDTEHWTYDTNKGGRYSNAVRTDGNLLSAAGQTIAELDGIYFGAGIDAGSLLIRTSMTPRGVQDQRSVPITLRNLEAGNLVSVTLYSSSKTAVGISSIVNMEGNMGNNSTSSTPYTYTFSVLTDGDVSFVNSGGCIFTSVMVQRGHHSTGQTAAKPSIERVGAELRITCATPDARIYYSLSDPEFLSSDGILYDAPFVVNRTCTVYAQAVCDGMRSSEVAELQVVCPFAMPYEGRNFTLAPEALSRGAVVVGSGSNALVSWRWLIDDPEEVAWNVYRDGTLVNATPIRRRTNLMVSGVTATTKIEVETLSGLDVVARDQARLLPDGYLSIPLQRPAGGTTTTGNYEYIPGDCMVADVDGDQEYEVVMKWDPNNQRDNSTKGVTGNVLIDCYRMDGQRLWRIDLGRNIRAGAHYTQLMVYDLDGDGKAEVACKTAPGTLDGLGQPVLLGSDKADADYRNSDGHVIKGSEYLTVFNGLTGQQLHTIPYRPARDTIAAWGDTYGNRSERYLAAVAYLDGAHPSLVMCRGYYTAAFLWAVDFDGTELRTRWLHSSTRIGHGAYGEGAHSMSVADVDGDECDELIYGSAVIDDDGTLIYRTGFGHGDALHVGDFVPDRKGLEIFMVHEEKTSAYGYEMRDALTGEVLSGRQTGTDVGRGLCADVDATVRGAEYWSTAEGTVFDWQGNNISSKRPSVNFRLYWDGDLQDEMFEGSYRTENDNAVECTGAYIQKWTGRTSSVTKLVDFASRYGAVGDLIKATPCLQADIMGDWREEVILYDNTDKSRLMIFTTAIASDYGVPTLMHDHQYRMQTVTQTAAYNQPPHLSYFLPDYVEYLKTHPHVAGLDAVTTLDGGEDAVYYSLTGQRLAQPAAGQVVVRHHNKKSTLLFY